MKGKSICLKYVLFYIFICSLLGNASCEREEKDPYKILGISRHATNQDIRHAYRQLAKEWHPDKNPLPDAEEKFIEIKHAYELLVDTDRRRVYDHYGVTNEDSHYLKQKHDYSQYGRYSSDPFEDFFGKHFFFDQDISLYHKYSITTNYYEQSLLQKSATVPYLIMFYNDWCFRCTRMVGAFKKLIDTLEPLGIHFATINAAHEPQIVRKSGISELPSLVLMLNGHSYIYRDSSYQTQNVVDFIRKKLPKRVYQKVNDKNFNEFLSGWMDNKVRVLIFEPRNITRLRFLISSYYFQYRVSFGFVTLGRADTAELQAKFKIDPSLDTVLIFNEDISRPVATVSMADIPTNTLNNIIASNQFLILPRLSSQDMLEGVCPPEWNRPRKKLCVILVTENSSDHNFAREALRNIAAQSGFSYERVRFAYIFKEKQGEFINAISKGRAEKGSVSLVIIWRRDRSHIKYEWLSLPFVFMEDNENNSNDVILSSTKEHINKTIQKLLKPSEALSYEATVQSLYDEHAQSFIGKCLSKISYFVEYITDNIEQEHILATLSLLGTIVFMFGIGYLMVYFVRVEEENLKSKGHISTENSSKKPAANRYVPELKLHELRAEKYNGMVRLLKPGCRAIILITDMQSRTKLIPPFHKAVWPYRKSKTLTFGHVLIEKGLLWYSELLRLSLSETKNLQINPRNCVGTVLALNGHRKYFCMYHAKHPESTRGAKRMVKMTRHLLKSSDDVEVGTFFEIEDSDESEIESKILLEENLLDGLGDWLDRLFEGSTHRYYINYWPDFPTK